MFAVLSFQFRFFYISSFNDAALFLDIAFVSIGDEYLRRGPDRRLEARKHFVENFFCSIRSVFFFFFYFLEDFTILGGHISNRVGKHTKNYLEERALII